ncbi:MAG TPA: NADH-quinone oxidoreductase subunit J [Gammaproteobacteria bacterium]|nr:NADH-quinone oxidoreductase subunit J [Gammaproteobacteria bacterium]
MGIEKFIFYIFSALLIGSAIMVISARNPVKAALFLVLAFFASAALWLLIKAEFLAIVLVLVYVGAVMVLFLFVVMMLDINIERMRAGFISYLPFGILVALSMAGMLIWIVSGDGSALDHSVLHGPSFSNTQELGMVLYTDYVYPFEIAAVILLVAIIAAITLTLRRRPNTKHQQPADQIAVKRNDRVRMVKMKAEERK